MKKTFAILVVLVLPFLVNAQSYQPFGVADQQTANTSELFKQGFDGGVLLTSQQQAAGLTGYFYLQSISEITGDTLTSDGQFHTGPAISMQAVTMDPLAGDTCITKVVSCVIDTSGGGFDTLAITYSNNDMLGWTALESQVPVVLTGLQTDTTYTGGAFKSDSVSVGFGAVLTLEPQGNVPGFSSGSVSVIGNISNVPPVTFSVANPGQTGMLRMRATSTQGITYSVTNWMPFVTLVPGEPDAVLDTISISANQLSLMIDLITGDINGNYIWNIYEPNNLTPVASGNGNISSTSLSIALSALGLDASTEYTVELIVQNSNPNSPFTFTWQVETAGLDDITYSVVDVTSTSSEVCAEIEITCPGQPGSLDLYIPEFGVGLTQALLVSAGTNTYTVCVQYPSDSSNITLEFIIEGLWDGQIIYATENHTTFDSELMLDETVGVSQLSTYDFSFDISYDGDGGTDVDVLITNQSNVSQVLYNNTFTYSPAPGSWNESISLTGIPTGENWIITLTATTADGLHTETRVWGFSTLEEIVEEIATQNVQTVNEVDQVITVNYQALLNNGGISIVTLYVGQSETSMTSNINQQALNGANGNISHIGTDTIDYSSYATAGWDRLYFIHSITSPQGVEYFAGNHNFFDIPEEVEPDPLYGPVIIGTTQGSIGETHASIRYEVDPRDSVGVTGYLEVIPEGEPMITTASMPYSTQMENMWQLLDLTPGTDHEYRLVLTDQFGNDFMWSDYFLFTTEEEVVVDPNGIEEVLAVNYNAQGLLYNSMGQLIDGNAKLRDYQYGHDLGPNLMFWVGDEVKLRIEPTLR